MSLEQLFFVAVLVLVLLFNAIGRRLRDRLESRERRDVAPRPSPTVPPALAGTARVVESRGQERHVRQVPRPSPPGAAPALGRWSGLRVLSRREARRGIVLMTVLGPCRSLELLRGGPGEPRLPLEQPQAGGGGLIRPR